MELGIIGLGRMGGNMAQRLLAGDHRVVVYDPQATEAISVLVRAGAGRSMHLEHLVSQLTPPRVVWVMVPAGDVTESVIKAVSTLLSEGDVVIDGGNSNYKDSMRRSKELSDKGVKFLDVGTSGGVWGRTEGYSLMIGGDEETYRRLEPIFQALAPSPETGYGFVGPAGAGHFVKMVHNGIEYGLMQAYAEGFELMEAKQEFDLDLAAIADIWRYGSVVRSWLLDLTAAALYEDPQLEGIRAYVEDSGEGRWTIQESVDLGVPVPVITAALQTRFRSRQDQPLSAKILAAMRNQFGGHSVRRIDE